MNAIRPAIEKRSHLIGSPPSGRYPSGMIPAAGRYRADQVPEGRGPPSQILRKIFRRYIQKQISQNTSRVADDRIRGPYGPAKRSGPRWVRSVDATNGFMSWAIR